MAAITVGDSSWPNALSDNPTPANGTYAIYMNPGSININWMNILVNKLAVQGDNTLSTTAGGNELTIPFAQCEYEFTVANMAMLLIIQQYWSTRDSPIYLTMKDKNGVNAAVFVKKAINLKDGGGYTPRAYNADDFEQITSSVTSMKIIPKEEYMSVTFNTLRSSL